MKKNVGLFRAVFFFTFFLVTALSALCTAQNEAGKKNSTDDLKLWYSKPAAGWLEALPLGNGRIGAMVFGGVPEDRVILNESSLYSREPSIIDTLPDITRHIDILSRMIKNGEYADADEYSTKHVTGPAVPCYQPLGDIVFKFSGQDKFSDYKRELGLSDAVAKTNYSVGGTNFTKEVFVSHPDNVVIIRIKAGKQGALNFNLSMESVHPTATMKAEGNNEFSFAGQLPGIALRRTLEWVEEWGQQWKYPEIWKKDGVRRPEASAILYNQKGIKFEARVRVLSCDGRVSSSTQGLGIKGAQEVVIAVAVASSFNGFDKDPVTEGLNPAELNQDVLAKLNNKSYKQLLQNHIVDYQKLFNRVSFQLPGKEDFTKKSTEERKTNYSLSADPSFAALNFQYGRYLLISCSREGGQPANLQGIWNVDRIPPWGSAYTTNINLQMNYWPAEVTNLSECHQPLFQFLKEVTVTGGKVAHEMYGLPGWVLHHNTSIWRGAHPVDWYGFISFWPMAGGWLCQHLWQHYLYTQDVQFLRETAYPIMKGAAEFYNAWLVDDGNGRLVTPVSDSPENQFMYIDEHGQKRSAGMAMGCTHDMAVIRGLFQNTIEAEKILQNDAAFSGTLKSRLPKLLPYQIGSRGQFLEYYKEFIESPPRHNTSPYYPLYPGNQFTKNKSPELFESVKNLIESRTGSRPGGGGWMGAWYATLWARFGEREKTLSYIENLVSRTHLNLFSGGGAVFQIDANLGYTAAVAEMLLQSCDGAIELLPALPKTWDSGSISGLRAEGGFEVSMKWQGAKLASATIKSIVGTNAKVRCGDKTIDLKLKPGETVHLNAGLAVIK